VATSATFKQVKRIKDDRFEEDNIHEYSLLLNIGPRDLQVAVLDASANSVLFLEDYIFPAVSSKDDLLVALDELFDQHAFLKAGFWKNIKIAYKNQKMIQVPQSLFIPESAAQYLRFNAHYNKAQEEVRYVEMKNSQAITVFTIQNELHAWFEQHYPKRQFTITHQSAALIEGVMEYAKSRNDNPLYLYVDRFKIHLLSVADNQLIYYNQFLIQNFQDYVKYIMMVLKTLEMDQNSSQVILWGYIGSNSQHYNELYKYIRNVTFGHRPKNLSFGYVFDEVQDHHYFDLYSINHA